MARTTHCQCVGRGFESRLSLQKTRKLMLERIEDYLPEQNKNELPLHKSGIELASSIANITSSAMLINQDHLSYEPEMFVKNTFVKEREYLIQQPKEKQEILLEQLSLNLTKDYKKKLKKQIDSFIEDFNLFTLKPNTKPYTTFQILPKTVAKTTNGILNTKLSKGYERNNNDNDPMKEFLYELLESEISMQSTFEIYLELAMLLAETGVDISIFEYIMKSQEKESYIEHSTH